MWYLDAREDAVIGAVNDGGKRLTALTENGETIEFVLRRSTGMFHSTDSGSRLTLLSDV